MIKLGEKRINIENVTIFCPDDSDRSTNSSPFCIRFDLIDGSQENIEFKTAQERDEMLQTLDKYLVTFDNGIIKSSKTKNMPSFIIDDTDLGGSGPGGISMQ